MQIQPVNNKEMLVFHVFRSTMEHFAFNIAVSSFIPTCTCSHRSCSLNLTVIWSFSGRVLCGLCFISGCCQRQRFSYFSASLSLPPFFLTIITVMGAWMAPCWGSWLGCRDCQPWGRLTVQGLADHSGGPWTSQAPTLHSV